MNKQTKELDLVLSNIRFEAGSVGLQFLSPIARREILRACKEAGLRFVDLPAGYTDEGIEEIDV